MPRIYNRELRYSNGNLSFSGTGYDKDGKFIAQGWGRKYSEDGTIIYDGYWVNDQWNGEGKQYYPDGTLYYEGFFLDGKPNGKGKCFFQNGTIEYEGDFADGEKYGEGRLYSQEGELLYEGTFADDKQVDASSGSTEGESGKSFAGADVEKYLGELEAMIGLQAVKVQVRSLANLIRLQKERAARNLPVTAMSYHMVFTGNPGTGKTTVARLIGKIYAALGVISKGNVVETDRAGLVAEYIGQTEAKTEAKIDEAKGGILFIDEAYALVRPGSSNDFGKEVIDCLMKRMEDYRDDLVVIVAGYENEMNKFLEANPGLKSRFNHHIKFEDYTLSEIVQILVHNCEKSNYIFRDEAKDLFASLMEKKLKDPAFREKFSNGRYVRNIFEKVIIAQSNRLATIDFSAADNDTLVEILAEDIQSLVDNGDFDRTF